ncbi:ATP-binding protein [Roseibium sp.]|uniref:ATP-binding protein n=1 Tax=Roseibium sp. TaxID=1936156 RepID=UPI003A975D18
MKRWIEVDDRSAIAAVRRLSRRHASALGLSEARVEELAIVVTEATTNIVRYAGSGRVLIEAVRTPVSEKLVLVFTDNGPGIANIDMMMRDGTSTSESAGLGLGAIQRLSDSFDVFSSAEAGTTIVCTFEVMNNLPVGLGLEVDGLRVCYPTENTCGDAWMIRHLPPFIDVLLCDGLGHGPKAAEAADELIALSQDGCAAPSETIARLSEELIGHRGAVVAMVRLDMDARVLSYAGIGNITTMIVGAQGIKRFAVRDGRIGGPAVKGFEETRELEVGDVLIMHSDGLTTLREGDLNPALLNRSPLLIAGFLLDRMFRGRDDASIVVARVKGE